MVVTRNLMLFLPDSNFALLRKGVDLISLEWSIPGKAGIRSNFNFHISNHDLEKVV